MSFLVKGFAIIRWFQLLLILMRTWSFFRLRFLSLQPAHEKIGVVDSQWIVHQVIPSLGSQVSQQVVRICHMFICAFVVRMTHSVLSLLDPLKITWPFSSDKDFLSNSSWTANFQGESENGKAPWEGVSIFKRSFYVLSFSWIVILPYHIIFRT